MMLRFAKTVEDLGLFGKKGRLLIKKTVEFQQPLWGDSRVVKILYKLDAPQ
jgi:hypothetical protein